MRIHNEVTIIEYEPQYAARIAAMWNASQASWGGENSLRTEKSVLKEHHNSGFLHVFLAIADNEVVGYCSFSHYKEDAHALYIPFLNVRPDYHGYKIGKRLILRAIEETLKLGWPRLDLYTWPGNLKAVPAYKKSGFFWEKRDDTTHLMNLIPSVLQTDAVKDYFDNINWYTDSIREISVNPDGREELGFDYFTYEWKNESLSLKMEYERTGRGLRLIETDDYLIKATIPEHHQLPFGVSYPIVYEAINKTGKALTLEIKSVSNTSIDFNLEEIRIVKSKERIVGNFLVHPIEEEQNAFETHPVVEADLLINGRCATFKIGVKPTFPVKLKLQTPDRPVFVNENIEVDLTMENKYDTDRTFEFELPSDTVVSFCEPAVRILVPAKDKRTVTVMAQLISHGIWHHRIDIYNNNKSDNSIILCQAVSLVFSGVHAAFGGETEQDWLISNGQFSIRLNKSNSVLSIYEGTYNTMRLHLPQFGLPYTNEYKKTRSLQVSFRQEESMILEAEYDLTKVNLLLIMIVKLYSNGTVSRHHLIKNKTAAPATETFYLKETFEFGLENSIIPYKNEYLDLRKGPDATDSDYWDVSNFTENWIFTDDGKLTRGITWPSEAEFLIEGPHYGIEQKLNVIPARGSIQTQPIRIALGTWKNWREFRSFALNNGSFQKLDTIRQLETKVNNGNPFVKGLLEISLVEQKNTYLDGNIHISSALNSIEPNKHLIVSERQLTEIAIPIYMKTAPEVDILSIRLDMTSYEEGRSRIVFPISDQIISTRTSQTVHGKVLTADNGVIQIQACNDFAPSLFSLKHHGTEWLSSSFPHPGPNSWWNPWIGGISVEVYGMSESSLLDEERETSFVEVSDNLGNIWSGIRVNVRIRKNEVFKGLSFNQYFIMLPGVPVLSTVTQVAQNCGEPLYPLRLANSTFYRASNDLSDTRVYVENGFGDHIIYKAGKVQSEFVSASGIIHYGSQERKSRLTLVAHPEMESCESYVNTHVVSSVVSEKRFLKDGELGFGKPQFYVISDLLAPEEAYRDLHQIRFD
ncbi:GNAT family N-acetyltransferase [Paenibacillus polymyxa]|uniref:GNAT family N-acetyltransferase n=1 Tax=Paenibacillus polymyxa TaxID=1406 RepID=UPI0023FA3F3F|nr:GNAT family N-acetyltransferase [Paenibacillus polymyxa]